MAVDFVSSGHGVDGDYRDKRSVPEFVQPLLVEKTEAMKKEESIVSKDVIGGKRPPIPEYVPPCWLRCELVSGRL